MSETIYPTLEEALYLHEKLILKFGGNAGVLDYGLLESALARPRSGYYNSLSEQAAALMQSLALNHCFADGNKRIAFALTATFLLMNGYRLIVNALEAEDFIINKLIASKASILEISTWLESGMRKK
jgi:death-on-curing protein